MNQSSLRRYVLESIERRGRRLGAPIVNFPERTISIPGENIYVSDGIRYLLTLTSGFYIPLPPNTFGVVIFPDGTSRNMEGGVHEVPPGFYRLYYVDNHERLDHSSPISELTTDGEKLSLKVVLRYRVNDPVTALQMDHPVKTLVEHVEADLAQYIRTHDHGDIVDGAEQNQDGKLLSFFVQRHNRRISLSNAFLITGVELVEFTGDNEYVEMRRKASMELRKNRIEKEQTAYQQELTLLKAQYMAENEKGMAVHKAELEKMEARHEREKQEILDQVRRREIDLENKRKHLQMRRGEFSEVIEAISRNLSSGMLLNPNVMKSMLELLNALKEEIEGESDSSPQIGEKSSSATTSTAKTASLTSAGSDKVEKLKNTLLNLLNQKR